MLLSSNSPQEVSKVWAIFVELWNQSVISPCAQHSFLQVHQLRVTVHNAMHLYALHSLDSFLTKFLPLQPDAEEEDVVVHTLLKALSSISEMCPWVIEPLTHPRKNNPSKKLYLLMTRNSRWSCTKLGLPFMQEIQPAPTNVAPSTALRSIYVIYLIKDRANDVS